MTKMELEVLHSRQVEVDEKIREVIEKSKDASSRKSKSSICSKSSKLKSLCLSEVMM